MKGKMRRKMRSFLNPIGRTALLGGARCAEWGMLKDEKREATGSIDGEKYEVFQYYWRG